MKTENSLCTVSERQITHAGLRKEGKERKERREGKGKNAEGEEGGQQVLPDDIATGHAENDGQPEQQII